MVQDFSHQQLTVCHEVLVARNFVPAVASAIKTLDKARDSMGLSLGGDLFRFTCCRWGGSICKAAD